MNNLEININPENKEIVINSKKKYDYGDRYKNRYVKKQYYNPEYHQKRYVEKSDEYKQHAELRKLRVKKAIEILKSQGIQLNSL